MRHDLKEMYANYKKTPIEEIVSLLTRIKLVKLTNHGAGTLHGYYPLTAEGQAKIISAPRNNSLTFDIEEEVDKVPLTDLVIYKELPYLVKSSSRFFYKPDVGEIIDQMTEYDKAATVAIQFNGEYNLIDGTDGEHFVATAVLLTYNTPTT